LKTKPSDYSLPGGMVIDNNGNVRIVGVPVIPHSLVTASKIYAVGVNLWHRAGEYKIYQSSILSQGANFVNTAINNAAILTITDIDIGGYASHIVDSSKMRIDVNTNMLITHPTSIQRNFSTFITQNQGNIAIGSPVVVNYTATSISLPNMTFVLNAADLTGFSGPLQLKCLTDSSGFINTLLPTVGGIHITLDNTD
jgi:hypothetical protein